MDFHLNRSAARLAQQMADDATVLRVAVHDLPGGGRLLDCGVATEGGLEAGRRMAEVCLGGLAHVSFAPSREPRGTRVDVLVATDHPVAACLAAQYAGWRVSKDRYFAMGSGPMRAAAAREEIFQRIGHRETTDVAVGVLETRRLPPPEVVEELAEQCHVTRDHLTLLVAPTASQAGTVQIVARSIETALHKLHELDFDVGCVTSGAGVAPLPPVAADDLAAIGRTNDAILYGGAVTLWVHADDELLADVGPKVPSSASADHGRPFAEIFASHDHDFYKIDPHLFSPASIAFVNLDTGRTFQFGRLMPEVMAKSFGVA